MKSFSGDVVDTIEGPADSSHIRKLERAGYKVTTTFDEVSYNYFQKEIKSEWEEYTNAILKLQKEFIEDFSKEHHISLEDATRYFNIAEKIHANYEPYIEIQDYVDIFSNKFAWIYDIMKELV